MAYEFKKISASNGLLDKLWREWDASCTEFEEDFSEYSTSSMGTLRSLAEEPEVDSRGMYGVCKEDNILAVCQLNVAMLPRYDGKVLRVRHITLAPEFDYSETKTIEDYAETLREILLGTLLMAETDMVAPHLKFHLRSPNDKEFFTNIRDYLANHDLFELVDIKGSWLYMSKNRDVSQDN